jgi:hypothetical protein
MRICQTFGYNNIHPTIRPVKKQQRGTNLFNAEDTDSADACLFVSLLDMNEDADDYASKAGFVSPSQRFGSHLSSSSIQFCDIGIGWGNKLNSVIVELITRK